MVEQNLQPVDLKRANVIDEVYRCLNIQGYNDRTVVWFAVNNEME